MAAKRTLAAVLTAGLAGGLGLAQTPPPAAAPPVATQPPPASAGTGSPFLTPPAAPAPSATGVLTAPPTVLASPALPAGSYAGPYVGPGFPGGDYSGPVGAHGPLTYELYGYTGPSFIVGGDKHIDAALSTGWAVGGGGKTLHFNPTGDAAWVLTTGLGYLYSGGGRDYIGVATRTAAAANNPDPVAEPVNAFRVKAFNRVFFEYAVGRDWWLNGPALVGGEHAWNSRFGFDVGGRWGSNSISLNPVVNPQGTYFRRSSVFHALTVGTHYTFEVPMGAWIGFVGGRIQYAYNWSNVVPPVGGNTQDLGLLFTWGVRF